MIQSNNALTQGDGTGIFTGSITYTYAGGGATTATLEIDLTNKTASGGHDLTGFALNSPRDTMGNSKISSVSILSFTGSNAGNFGLLFSDRGVAVSPWGNADFGAALSSSKPDWEGGGNPNDGLAPGTSGVFKFTLGGTAANLAMIMETSFVNALTTGGGGGSVFFAVRFRGGNNSDKEPGIVTPSPEPSAFVLWALCGLSVGCAPVISGYRKKNGKSPS